MVSGWLKEAANCNHYVTSRSAKAPVFYKKAKIFEWKIKEGGNTGIKYNAPEGLSTSIYKHAAIKFEYQILDDNSELYQGKFCPFHFTASLYDMIAPLKVNFNPAGVYKGCVVLNGNHEKHWLNGVKVVEFELGTTLFDSLFQQSKYHKFQGFDKNGMGIL